jgi:hypothetical protein
MKFEWPYFKLTLAPLPLAAYNVQELIDAGLTLVLDMDTIAAIYLRLPPLLFVVLLTAIHNWRPTP